MHGVALKLAGGASSRAALRHIRPCLRHSNALHTRTGLSYRPENGLGDFLSPAALQTIAVEYQQGLLDRLNDEVRGTALEHKSIVQTIIEASAHPDLVLPFNYASEALNNSFFLQSLQVPVKEGEQSSEVQEVQSSEDYISSELRSDIIRNFKSLEQLKSTVGGMALGMFSPGWVWLVCDRVGSLAVLPTFGAETMLVRSGKPYVPPKLNTDIEARSSAGSLPSSGMSQSTFSPRPSSPSRSFAHSAVRSAVLDNSASSISDAEDRWDSTSKIGGDIFPLICLSVHERTWMSAGYGVWGKEEYVKRFWPAVNWQGISEVHAALSTSRSLRP